MSAELATLLRYYQLAGLPKLPTQGTPFGPGGDLEMHNPPPDKEALEQATSPDAPVADGAGSVEQAVEQRSIASPQFAGSRCPTRITSVVSWQCSQLQFGAFNEAVRQSFLRIHQAGMVVIDKAWKDEIMQPVPRKHDKAMKHRRCKVARVSQKPKEQKAHVVEDWALEPDTHAELCTDLQDWESLVLDEAMKDNESNLALYMHIPYCRDVHSFLGRQYKKMAQTAGQGEATTLHAYGPLLHTVYIPAARSWSVPQMNGAMWTPAPDVPNSEQGPDSECHASSPCSLPPGQASPNSDLLHRSPHPRHSPTSQAVSFAATTELDSPTSCSQSPTQRFGQPLSAALPLAVGLPQEALRLHCGPMCASPLEPPAEPLYPTQVDAAASRLLSCTPCDERLHYTQPEVSQLSAHLDDRPTVTTQELLDWVFESPMVPCSPAARKEPSPCHLKPDWSCLPDSPCGAPVAPVLTTQELVDWAGCQPQSAHSAVSGMREGAQDVALPQVQKPHVTEDVPSRVLQTTARGRRASPPTVACPDSSLLATRVWQVQRLSPIPVSYKVALQAATCHWDNFQAAVTKALELSGAPSSLLAQGCHMDACEGDRATSPHMRGRRLGRTFGFSGPAPRSRTPPHMPGGMRTPPTRADDTASASIPSDRRHRALNPASSAAVLLRWANEVHWYTVEMPTSGSVLHSLAQASLFHAQSVAPSLRLTDEDSGCDVPNTEALLDLQEMGVLTVNRQSSETVLAAGAHVTEPMQGLSVSPSSAFAPAMTEGMIHPRTPRPEHQALEADSVRQSLLQLGVAPPLAREAANLHPHSLDAALDWACASHRRRNIPRVVSPGEVLHISDSEEEDEERTANQPSTRPLPIPVSWHCHASSPTRSWLYVPLLKATAGILDPEECSAWYTHAAIGRTFRDAACLLAASAPQELASLHVAFAAAGPAAMTLPDAVRCSLDSHGYIPAELQEVLLQAFSRDSRFLQTLDHLAEAGRVPPAAAAAALRAPVPARTPGGSSARLEECARAYWAARQRAIEDTVEKLYRLHLRHDPKDVAALAASFHALPLECPVQPSEFGLSTGDVLAHELTLWQKRVEETSLFACTIQFAEKAGIACEFPAALALTMVRPRIFSVLIADSNCGKSPFFEQCLDPIFVQKDEECPPLVQALSQRFFQPGPGKDKTLFVQQCTNSDFARRMKATSGHLFWMTEEAWSCLDVAWATSRGKGQHTPMKVQHCYLQNTQNGLGYGPVSINSEQFFVPTTNFAMFHAGHFPRCCEVLLDLIATLCGVLGHTLDSRELQKQPIELTPHANQLWQRIRQSAEQEKTNVPEYASAAVGKHCFTTTSHVLSCHLLQQAFSHAKAHYEHIELLRNGSAEYLHQLETTPLASLSSDAAEAPVRDGDTASWLRLPSHLLLCAPEHIYFMLSNVMTCYNEMNLPDAERAGPHALDEAKARRFGYRSNQPAIQKLFDSAQRLDIGVVPADSPVILVMCGGQRCCCACAPPAAAPARLQGQGANAAGAADGQAPADEADRQQKRGPGVLPVAERVNIYTVCTHVDLETPFDGKEAFLQHEKAWAQRVVPGEVLNIRHQYYDQTDGFKVFLWCNSCDCCKNRNGWRGYSTYQWTDEFKRITRAYTPVALHGDFRASKNWNPLCASAENALKEHVKQHAHMNIQDLAKIVERHHKEGRPVSDDWLKTWLKNHRPHKGNRANKNSKFTWCRADWDQLRRNLGTVSELPDDLNAAVPDALKIAAEPHTRDCTVVVFCNPALLQDTLTRLTNKHYVKLCGDGTFRLTESDWVLLSVGAISKHYAASSSVFAFRSTFNPLMFALTNKEAERSYKVFFRAVLECSHKFAAMDLATACCQYHADLHAGEELARKAVFPNSDRVADWAHVTGACARPKFHKPSKDEKLLAYRNGIYKTMQKALSPAGQKLLPLLERAFHCLRAIPTALLFHTVVHALLQTLRAQQPAEHKAATAFRKHYLDVCTDEVAAARYQTSDWVGHPAPLLLADWCMEFWHKNKLKKYMGLRTALDSFGASLAQFSSSRLQNLKAQSTPLPDVPGEPFPDKALLYDSNFLMREGRTSAQQFRKTGAYDIWSDGEGTTFFAFPRTLCKYDSAAKTWNRVADEEVQPVPAGTAASLAKVFLSRTAASLQEALRSMGLGVDPLRDIEQLLRLLHKYVLVLVGDAATRHWKLERRLENPSTRKLCARSARTFAFTDAPVPVLLPAASRSPAQGSKSAADDDAMLQHAAVARLLRSLSMQQWAPAVLQEQLSLDDLATMTFGDLRLALPASIPSGVVRRLQQAAQNQPASSSRKSFKAAEAPQSRPQQKVGLPVRLCPGQVEPTLRSALRKRLYPMPVLPARPGSQLLFVRFLGEGILYLCVICHNVQGRV
ncbi:unnamed protein product [Symbiodinium microadriaticum]|nr:unnamed protein product [Symbiodinium microadriaticum]